MAAAFAGKFFVTAAFAIAFLYGAELFPTESDCYCVPNVFLTCSQRVYRC